MSSSNSKKHGFFREFSKELKKILSDVLFMYRNFIHWNLSKLSIFIWSLILGVIIALPVFFIAVIVWLIDPISWSQLAASALSWQDPSFELMAGLAEHPYSLWIMVFLACCMFLFFLLWSSYSLLLIARLSLKYTERKKLSLKKNLYFARKHIRSFLFMSCLNTAYILFPIFIWIVLVAGVRILWVSPDFFEIFTVIVLLLCIWAIIYIIYRIIFGYIILADQKRSDKVHSGKSYIKSSRALTPGKNIWKFLFLLAVYTMLMTPFNSYELHLEKQTEYMSAALAYKTWNVSNISESELSFYKYLSAQYGDMANDELQEKIIAISNIRIVYAITLYLVFWGLWVMLLASFYRRVLLKK